MNARDIAAAYRALIDQSRRDLIVALGERTPIAKLAYLVDVVSQNRGQWSGGPYGDINIAESARHAAALQLMRDVKID